VNVVATTAENADSFKPSLGPSSMPKNNKNSQVTFINNLNPNLDP
jgi:hypothetical protein